MREDVKLPFEPRALRTAELAVTVTPGLRKFPREERDAVLAARRANDARLQPWAPPVRRRVANWVLGAVIFLPLLTLLVTPLGFASLLFQVPVAALWGLGMGWLRPRALPSGLVLLGLGATLLLLGGRAPLSASPMFLLQVSALMTYFLVGYVLGVVGQLSRSDGV